MNTKKNIRRIQYLIYKFHFIHWSYTVRDRVNEVFNWERLPCTWNREELNELKHLLDNTIISQKEMEQLYAETCKSKGPVVYKFDQKPIIRRDNKGVHIGNGASSYPTVRYPSKKRSLRTWKIFYDMFPYYAEKDNWDGKTSDKMK